MRASPLLVVLLVACGKKSAPETSAPDPAPAPVSMPTPAPEPEPEPEAASTPPSARPHNTSFAATITYGDGSSQKGNVVRVERSQDWFGDTGWTDSEGDLEVTLEGGGTEVDVPWTDIRQVDVTYGDKDDIDCSYDSAFTPTMYMCTLRTTTRVKTKDGKTWDAADRHKWLFVFDSGDAPEFWISKLPERKQEEEVPSLGTVTENTALYQDLQQALLEQRGGKVPKSITITAE